MSHYRLVISTSSIRRADGMGGFHRGFLSRSRAQTIVQYDILKLAFSILMNNVGQLSIDIE